MDKLVRMEHQNTNTEANAFTKSLLTLVCVTAYVTLLSLTVSWLWTGVHVNQYTFNSVRPYKNSLNLNGIYLCVLRMESLCSLKQFHMNGCFDVLFHQVILLLFKIYRVAIYQNLTNHCKYHNLQCIFNTRGFSPEGRQMSLKKKLNIYLPCLHLVNLSAR